MKFYEKTYKNKESSIKDTKYLLTIATNKKNNKSVLYFTFKVFRKFYYIEIDKGSFSDCKNRVDSFEVFIESDEFQEKYGSELTKSKKYNKRFITKKSTKFKTGDIASTKLKKIF